MSNKIGELSFVVEKNSEKYTKAYIYCDSYQQQLHDEAVKYFEERKKLSTQYEKRYNSNPLYQQIFNENNSISIDYSSDFMIKSRVDNLFARFSEPNLNEAYNIMTYRNYWNFIREDIKLQDF